MDIEETIAGLDPTRHVLIAGPTASGKSALALRIARAQGGTVVNADTLQVYAGWRVLTARPSPQEIASAPHALYGHVPDDVAHSVGDWLREVAPRLERGRCIVVGGTGLFFRALTEGLAEIPQVPDEVRAAAEGRDPAGLRGELDPVTAARIDLRNPVRVRRAWEVLHATGRGLAAWQDATPPPILPPDAAHRLVIEAPPEVLTPRIARRFDAMLADGALDEVRAKLDAWNPALPSSRAIGAAELVAHLRGETDLDTARVRAVIATRRYAKRQRTWFRARMGAWQAVRFAGRLT
ncbi:MAG: tRNA (adenosine(37)-N6)-dimethylallyltransferase MiaA [Shimia sp.]